MKYKDYEDKAMKYSKDKADDQESIDIITQAYIEGFLKAREMSYELLCERDYGLPDLLNVGEDEV